MASLSGDWVACRLRRFKRESAEGGVAADERVGAIIIISGLPFARRLSVASSPAG
jgi:hypothetical protein